MGLIAVVLVVDQPGIHDAFRFHPFFLVLFCFIYVQIVQLIHRTKSMPLTKIESKTLLQLLWHSHMLFLSFPEVQSKTCPKSFGQSSWKTHGCMLDEPCFPPTFSKKSKGLSCGNSTLKPLHSRHGYAPDSLENLRTLCLLEMELFRVGYQSEIVRVTLSVLRCREMS